MPRNTLLRWSLKTRVAVFTLGIFLISFWSLAFYASKMLREDMERQLGEHQFATVSFAADEINDNLIDRFNALERIAASISPQTLHSAQAIQAFLENCPLLQDKFNGGILAHQLEGTAVADIPLAAGRRDINYMDIDSVAAALKQSKTSISKPVIGKKLGAPIFSMTTPIRDEKGQVIGALTGVTNLGRPNFLDKITAGQYGDSGRYGLIAPQHRLIVTASNKRRAMQALPSPGTNPLLDRYLAGHDGFGIAVSSLGVEELSAAKHIPATGWLLGLMQPTAKAFAPIRAMQWRMLTTALLLSLLATGLTWWMQKRELAPLIGAATKLRSWSDARRPLQAVPFTAHDEIGGLIASFNHLLESLAQREDALKASESRWKFAIEGAGDGLWDWNIADNTVFFSLQWKQMLGFADAEIGTAPGEWVKRIHPDDKAETLDSFQAYLDGKAASYISEHRFRCKDGSYKWVLDRGMVVARDQDGRPIRVIGTHCDITERKLAESRLQAAKAAVEKADHAKSRFLAAASHDLRQPLAALALYVGVLSSEASTENGDLVAHIEDCVGSLTELLNDLLDVSKLDAGVVTPNLSDFTVDELLDRVVSVHCAEAAMKGLRLLQRGCGEIVRADQQLLYRIVGNLVVNAIRYTEKGGVLIACRRHQGKRWIEVWDTGVGIPEDQTAIIFEDFRQLGDEARNRGSGLGLAIVARAAALLGLNIRVRSRPGRGSMFAIELPSDAATLPEPPQAIPEGTTALRIALVEDNPHVLNALALALQAVGHQVIAAESASTLIQGLDGQKPDIVISDYRLAQGARGFDVIAATRHAFDEHLPAIIITGDTDPGLIRSMADQGIAVHYKPFRLNALNTAIDETIRHRETESQMTRRAP